MLHFTIDLVSTKEDGYLNSNKNEPIVKVCEIHLLVNLLITEKAIEMNLC